MSGTVTVYVRETEHEIEVDSFSEFLRDANGDCAFCKGDPCAEDSPKESLIWRHMFKDDGTWSGESTCPVCDGRPT